MLENSFLKLALFYATRGWRLFPAHTIANGVCTCKKGEVCKSSGKHPIFSGWQREATTGLKIVKKWWSRPWNMLKGQFPNIGIATGYESNLFVLDIDPGAGGDDSLFELEKTSGVLPKTAESITGSGGNHKLFTFPSIDPGNKVSFSPGLDTRSTGGLIIAPPSLHKSGCQYLWELDHLPSENPLAPLPNWLLEIICTANQVKNFTPKDAIKVSGKWTRGPIRPKRGFDVLGWILANGIKETRKLIPWITHDRMNPGIYWDSGDLYRLTCLWNPEHTGDAFVIQFHGGGWYARCFHNRRGCPGQFPENWRDQLTPGWKDKITPDEVESFNVPKSDFNPGTLDVDPEEVALINIEPEEVEEWTL